MIFKDGNHGGCECRVFVRDDYHSVHCAQCGQKLELGNEKTNTNNKTDERNVHGRSRHGTERHMH